jgi:hypothetical protein
VTKRQQRRAMAEWESETRTWATGTARALALAMCGGEPIAVNPYRVGVVLDLDEHAWAECPLRFLQESSPAPARTFGAGWPPFRPWLVTSRRIVARLGDGRLYGYRWEHALGCRVDLTPARETVALDLCNGTPLVWTGPGIAPLAVAAVHHLHGSEALLDHPGLAPLRVDRPDGPVRTQVELTSGECELPSW